MGGNACSEPGVAQEVASGLDDAGILQAMVNKFNIVNKLYKLDGCLVKTIDRIGIEPLKKALQ